VKLPIRPRDTIAWRFTAMVAAAAIVTAALAQLFLTFGGAWARPSLERSGLLDQGALLVRIIEAAPPQMRQGLAVAATTGESRVDWYAPGSSVAAALEGANDGIPFQSVFHGALNKELQSLVVFRPDSRIWTIPAFREAGIPGVSRLSALKLTDGSWLVAITFRRQVGLEPTQRLILWVIFTALSGAVVSALAARQLSRPIVKLADAVHLFGLDPHARPIPETGPHELRQVIRSFNAAQAQIVKFTVYRTMMLAAISHDLRTPLTRMRLRGEFIEDEEQQAKLFRDVDEMQMMVDGALAFFRDDTINEAMTDFDLADVLHTVVNDYADQGIDVGYIGPIHAVYRGRPFALKRAFTNLVENAIKYATPPEIELFRGDHMLVVSFRDRGPGLPSDALERVFGPFYRLDKSRNRATGGVGLGLTAAQAIVRAHGGDIALENRPDGGLEARVTLPEIVKVGNDPSSKERAYL
jgi:signal transduction histidine kinase